MTHDPIITEKIQFIKKLLKQHTLDVRENKKLLKLNRQILNDNGYCSFYEVSTETRKKLGMFKYVDIRLIHSIIEVHIYYLRLKGVSKRHTKDDAKYENSNYYKATISQLEKEFLVSQEVRKEGIYVTP
jgi:hypothetical protein